MAQTTSVKWSFIATSITISFGDAESKKTITAVLSSANQLHP
jgi:hypothetical protein